MTWCFRKHITKLTFTTTQDFRVISSLPTIIINLYYIYIYIYIQFIPRSEHSALVTQTSQLMLYREIIAVCSQIHTKHVNTLRGLKVKLLNVELVGIELRIKIQSVPRSKHNLSRL